MDPEQAHSTPEIDDELRIQDERDRARPDYFHVRVGDLPTKPIVRIPSTVSVAQAIVALKRESESVGLVVDAEDRLMGLVTLPDLVFDGLDDPEAPVVRVMSSPEVVCEDDTVADVLRWMLVCGYRQVPIVRDDRVAGMVRIDDVLAEIIGPHTHEIARRPADPTRGYVARYGA